MAIGSSVVAPVPCVGMGPSTRAVRLLLLRHGQSEWNAVKRWQGTADSPLTALGREQAIETAWALAGEDVTFTSVWSSDLSRARETATIIGDALAIGTPTADLRLREAYAGEWEGMTPEEIEAAYPGWLDEHRRPPSFEPLHEVVDRAVAALHDIARSSDGPALVVTHSGFIRSLVRHLGRQDDRVPNLGGLWVTVDPRPSSAADGIELHDVFDPAGIVVSGVDAPGEDPGDEPDQPGAHRHAEH